MKKKLIAITVLILFFVTGCGSQASSINTDRIKDKYKKITIGVSLLTMQHKFFQDLRDGLEKAASDYGIELNVTDSSLDLDRQVSDIENFISEGVNGIIMSPVDSKGVTEVINKAKAAHIFVVTVDIAADGVKVDSHVASDNVMGGRLAGEYAVKLLRKKGNVAIIDHHIVNSVIDRVAGFEEVLSKYPDIKIVAKKDCNGIKERAAVAASEMLEAHLNIDLIFAINDDACLGAISAIEGTDEAKKIAIIGYDATPVQQELIKKGNGMLKASVIQRPKKMGQVALETILKLLDGQKVDEKVLIEVGIFDKSGKGEL